MVTFHPRQLLPALALLASIPASASDDCRILSGPARDQAVARIFRQEPSGRLRVELAGRALPFGPDSASSARERTELRERIEAAPAYLISTPVSDSPDHWRIAIWRDQGTYSRFGYSFALAGKGCGQAWATPQRQRELSYWLAQLTAGAQFEALDGRYVIAGRRR
jgi:hypothetical protein